MARNNSGGELVQTLIANLDVSPECRAYLAEIGKDCGYVSDLMSHIADAAVRETDVSKAALAFEGMDAVEERAPVKFDVGVVDSLADVVERHCRSRMEKPDLAYGVNVLNRLVGTVPQRLESPALGEKIPIVYVRENDPKVSKAAGDLAVRVIDASRDQARRAMNRAEYTARFGSQEEWRRAERLLTAVHVKYKDLADRAYEIAEAKAMKDGRRITRRVVDGRFLPPRAGAAHASRPCAGRGPRSYRDARY